MKPSDEQKKICKWVQDHIQTWVDTNDIASPTHFVDLHDFIEAEINKEKKEWREASEENLSELLNLIRRC